MESSLRLKVFVNTFSQARIMAKFTEFIGALLKFSPIRLLFQLKIVQDLLVNSAGHP